MASNSSGEISSQLSSPHTHAHAHIHIHTHTEGRNIEFLHEVGLPWFPTISRREVTVFLSDIILVARVRGQNVSNPDASCLQRVTADNGRRWKSKMV